MSKNFKDFLNEKMDTSKEFAVATGIKKDSKNIGRGDVYFLNDNSSVVIDRDIIEYYDDKMNFITSYTSVKQAIKAFKQSGALNESVSITVTNNFELADTILNDEVNGKYTKIKKGEYTFESNKIATKMKDLFTKFDISFK